MSKFKIGDRVKIVDDQGSHAARGRIGEFGVVTESEGNITELKMDKDGKLVRQYHERFELVPWQPKVGDRVRMTKKVDGHMTDCSATIVTDGGMVGRFLLKFDKSQNFAHSGGGQVEYGFGYWVSAADLEPLFVPTLKLANGKFYRDADGKKVGPIRLSEFTPTSHPYYEQGRLGRWSANGVSHTADRANLVADWVDVPVAAQAQPAALKIEAGKFYKTRDGRKVGPMVASKGFYGYEWKFTVDHDFIAAFGKAWRADGTFSTERGKEHNADLIAEWPVEAKPVVAATVDYLADEYGSGVKAVNDTAPVAQQPVAKPKFKVGDKVDYVRDRDGQWLGVTINRVGMTSFGTMGYWANGRDGHAGLFEADHIALSVTRPTAIVALIEDGKPKPNSRPYVHATVESANVEAVRLANVHRGKQFGVYALTGEPVSVEPVKYDHEWQTLAMDGRPIDAIKALRALSGIGLKAAKDSVEDWKSRQPQHVGSFLAAA